MSTLDRKKNRHYIVKPVKPVTLDKPVKSVKLVQPLDQLRTFAPKSSHAQIFSKLSLQVENDKIRLNT